VPESYHPYAIDHGNPYLWIDPTGESSLIQLTVSMAIVGILASTALPAYSYYLKQARAYRAGWDAGMEANRLGQAYTDEIAGIGDTISFGIGKVLRDLAGWGGEVDQNSPSYNAGVAAGLVVSFLGGASIGAANAIRETVSVGAARLTVIGRHPTYVELGEQLGANYYNIPTRVWNAMSEGEKWLANRTFLDQAIARGDEFVLASGIRTAEAGSWFRIELEYLFYRGYRLAEDGKHLVLP
jgi:type II secretory pathway pseudopilin PulG